MPWTVVPDGRDIESEPGSLEGTPTEAADSSHLDNGKNHQARLLDTMADDVERQGAATVSEIQSQCPGFNTENITRAAEAVSGLCRDAVQYCRQHGTRSSTRRVFVTVKDFIQWLLGAMWKVCKAIAKQILHSLSDFLALFVRKFEALTAQMSRATAVAS